jgi:putative salt-induced outer membrane protein
MRMAPGSRRAITPNNIGVTVRNILIAAAVAATLLPCVTFANESATDTGWKGQGELGLAVSKGNTDSQTLVGKLDGAYEDELWKHSFGLAFLYNKSDDVESARRYEFFGNTGRRLSDRSYVLGTVRHERDHFSAYEYQWTAALGYGYEAIKSDLTHLTFEIGPGYRWSKRQGEQVKANEAIVRGYMDFGHQLTDTTSFYDTLLIEAGQDNTFARNNLGLQVAMTDALALKAGFEVRHNTDVLPGTKKTDTLTTVNVVYGF